MVILSSFELIISDKMWVATVKFTGNQKWSDKREGNEWTFEIWITADSSLYMAYHGYCSVGGGYSKAKAG